MEQQHLQILQHSLGVDEYGQGEQYRNHFCAGGDDINFCSELVAMGFMDERNSRIIHQSNVLFTVTEAGKQAMRDASPEPPKLTRGQLRYRLYLKSDSDQTFGEWIRDPYWNDYRARHGA